LPRRLFAFLRAINVGGHNVTMAELRHVFESLGLKEVETFIASGNVIFVSDSPDLEALGQLIEDRLQEKLGYNVTTHIRTASEVESIATCKPFTAAQLKTALALNVAFLPKPLGSAATQLVLAFSNANDAFKVRGREVYWLCRTKQSDSKFNNVRFEKMLNVRATWRGMNTIQRLIAKYASSS
jgi:uncharacterized protein (DUF1697 family)